jgi:heme O synthase-like polyprenyltransferase
VDDYSLAGIGLLVLAAFIALTHRRLALIAQTVPVLLLGLLVLDHLRWALVVGAVFASIWLLDQALSWRRHDPVQVHRPSWPMHALLTLVSLGVAALTWAAVAGVSVTPML